MNESVLYFFQLIRDFLSLYLPKQRGTSKNTIKSYRDALNLLLDFLCMTLQIPLTEISFVVIDFFSFCLYTKAAYFFVCRLRKYQFRERHLSFNVSDVVTTITRSSAATNADTKTSAADNRSNAINCVDIRGVLNGDFCFPPGKVIKANSQRSAALGRH